MRHGWGVRLSMVLTLAAGAGESWAGVDLAVVSAAPTRAHFVAAGTSTTFVISARNTSLSPVTLSLEIAPQGAGGDWQVLLFAADTLFRPLGDGSDRLALPLAALQTVNVVAQLTPGAGLPEGSEGGALVKAWQGETLLGTVDVAARVRNKPKVYYLSPDGCGSGYLALDRRGARYDGSRERLTPRLSSLLSSGAQIAKGTALLPSTTDGNHAAALTGSWPGTVGLFSVKTQYLGRDRRGRRRTSDGTRDLLRWGPDGELVQTMFDRIKDPVAGGTPGTYTAMVTGKAWLSELFRDGGTALDLVVNGKSRPAYVPIPLLYHLGDPPSDDNPDTDREGTNLGPRPTKKRYSVEALYAGKNPTRTPEDRWLGEATLRVIGAEDPDVLYLELSSCDTAQHIFGSADRPEEWLDMATPELWDDVNIYNNKANRDPILDIVYEADHVFGTVLDALGSRGVLDRSFLVVLSDHGATTVMNTPSTLLDVGSILLAGGASPGDSERIVTSGEMGWIALTDPSKSAQIEAILEAYEHPHPVLGGAVKPFVVINRAEMDSGIDGVEGRYMWDGVAGNRRGELYSEWCIDGPRTSLPRVRWPDLFIFNRHSFQNAMLRADALTPTTIGSPFHGHHGSPTTAKVMLALRGPGIVPGVYDTSATLADIAPTLYRLLGLSAPAHVDGRVLNEILAH
jgi:predicted AlkP superfamily pyrophosphatase or phosphodiesterase